MSEIKKIVLIKQFSNTGISNSETVTEEVNPYNFAVSFNGWNIDSEKFCNGILTLTLSENDLDEY